MDNSAASLQECNLEAGPSLDEVLGAAARGVCEALKADAAAIALLEGGIPIIRAHHGLPDELLANWRLDKDASRKGIVFRRGEPYVSTDIARDPNYAESQASKLGIRGVIMVPLGVSGEEIGCLYIGRFTPHRFTDDDVRVARVFAQQIAVGVANASLLERERRERQRSQALLELVRAAGSSLSLKQALIQVCEAATRLSVADRCSILLADEAGETLEPFMSLGFKDEKMWERFRVTARVPISFAPGTRDAFFSQKPILIGHADRTRLIPQSMVKDFGMKSVAIYPMVVRDRVVGIMVIDSIEDYLRFPEEELETMAAIARQAAVLIDNAQLFEREQKQRQRAEALFQAVGAVSSSLSLKKVLIKLCQSVVDLSVGDRCSFFLSQEGEERAIPIMSLGIEDPSLWEKFKGSSAIEASQVHGIREAFQSLEPIIEEHVPGSGLLPDYWVDTFNVKSLALYPLVHREKSVGVMAVDSFRDFVRFPPEEVATLAAIARQAAVVIENARLFEQEQKQRRRAEALLQVVGAASSSLSLQKVIIDFCRSVVDISVGERCSIFLADKSTGRLLPYMSLGPEDEGMWDKFRSIANVPPTEQRMHLAEAITLIRAPIIQENVPATGLLPRDWVENFGIKSIAIYPLVVKEETIGVMAVDSYSSFVHFPPEEVETMAAIARQAAVIIDNARLHERVQQQAIADPLTGLYNHRHLYERLEQEMARAKRSRRPVAVLMLDIDNLKLVNDTYGHQVGDEALKLLASVLQSSCRAEDIVGRYGGDEFMIILPEADTAEAERIGERIQANLAARYLEEQGKDGCVPIRISMGVACYPNHATLMHALVDAADAALYRSKQRGGGRISTARGRVEELMPADSGSFRAMQGLVTALIQKEPSMRHHTSNVAKYSVLAAAALGLSKKNQNILRRAGWVHDVGKIAVPDGVLLKPGPLNEDEWKVIHEHVDFSVTILRGIAHLADIVPAVAAHHEWFDGRGYPRGLKGRRIPVTARVLSVADAYSAMTNDRPYRLAMSREEAVEELQRGAGTQFDPRVVEAFVQVLEAEARETRAA
jgi:diguanylate cyclase (GGDEF)-like protein/putative nucleotidyltransferase with HDIG domain